MTFALITEGISEHRIIRHILLKYFKEQEPDINQIQPKIVSGKQANTGSWNEVLKYCTLKEEIQSLFVDNDYLIIQIDTDQSETKPFDISHTKAFTQQKTVEELHTDVVIKLISLFPSEILATYGQRIFLAVCVHTIECWMLPIYYLNNHRYTTKSCISKLNVELGRLNQSKIPTATKDKNNHIAIRAYDDILKNWKHKQSIVDASQYNAGFSRFITMLESVATAP